MRNTFDVYDIVLTFFRRDYCMLCPMRTMNTSSKSHQDLYSFLWDSAKKSAAQIVTAVRYQTVGHDMFSPVEWYSPFVCLLGRNSESLRPIWQPRPTAVKPRCEIGQLEIILSPWGTSWDSPPKRIRFSGRRLAASFTLIGNASFPKGVSLRLVRYRCWEIVELLRYSQMQWWNTVIKCH